MKWYSIGSLSFPASWAAVAAALCAAYLYVRLQGRKQNADFFSNAFFIFVITWKLSVVLFQFQSAVKNPLSIVYFHGGVKGYWLGMAAAFVYLFLSRNGSGVWKQRLTVEVWLLIITVYELVFFLLNKEHILLSGFQLIVNAILLYLLGKKSGGPAWSVQVLILFTCFQGLVYSMEGNLLSIPMMTYAAGCLILGLAQWKGSRKNE